MVTSTVHTGCHLRASFVDDADLLTRKRDPHRAGPASTGDRVDGGGTRCFRQAVTLDQRKSVASLETAQQFCGGRGGPADAEPQRRCVW